MPSAYPPNPLPPRPHRSPPGRRLPPPPIKQSVIAELLVTLAPAPHVPIADSDDLRCLPPRDLLRHRSQNHFLYLHRPAPSRPSCKRTCSPSSPTLAAR